VEEELPQLHDHPKAQKQIKMDLNYMRSKNEITNTANKMKFTKIPNKYVLEDLFEKHYGLTNGNETAINNLKSRIDDNGNITLDTKSLNVRGIKNNKIYVNQLKDESDILILQELLHGQPKVMHKCVDLENKQIFQRCGTKTSTRGRYSGGIAFIVNANINVSKSEFHNNNIGIIYINKLAIINVYLPFYNGINTENMEKYIADLNWLNDKVTKLKSEGKEIMIYGDFNTDFAKEYKYSKLLFSFMSNTNITPVDINHEKQVIQYTYEKKFKRSIVRTWIDHCLVLNSMAKKIIFIKIQRGLNNTSDHCLIRSKYNLILDSSNKTILAAGTNRVKEIKWHKKEQLERYKMLVDKSSFELRLLIDEHANANCEEEKILLATCFFNELSFICIDAKRKIVEEESTKKKKKINKREFTEEGSVRLKQLHRQKCLAYIQYRDTNWDNKKGIEYEKAKKDFRLYLRYHEKNKSNEKFRQLNELFKSDKNGFWRSVKKMNQLKQLVNVPLNEIIKIYKTLFNTSNMPDEERDEKDEEELDELIKEFQEKRTNADNIVVSKETIENIIKELKNGKAIGFSNVSNEMFF
jgi:hypothetical protein